MRFVFATQITLLLGILIVCYLGQLLSVSGVRSPLVEGGRDRGVYSSQVHHIKHTRAYSNALLCRIYQVVLVQAAARL
jgi:hypothetical protein